MQHTKYGAVIVVDMQTALVAEHPWHETQVLQSSHSLLQHCRKAGIPVIYVRHDGGVGDELKRGTTGWQIDASLAPQLAEPIFYKQYNSAFLGTGLAAHLTKIKADNFILCGVQTEYCVDVTCKAALEHGFQVAIAHVTTTTYDNDFLTAEQCCRYFEEKIWNGRYATVLPLEQLICEIAQ